MSEENGHASVSHSHPNEIRRHLKESGHWWMWAPEIEDDSQLEDLTPIPGCLVRRYKSGCFDRPDYYIGSTDGWLHYIPEHEWRKYQPPLIESDIEDINERLARLEARLG